MRSDDIGGLGIRPGLFPWRVFQHQHVLHPILHSVRPILDDGFLSGVKHLRTRLRYQ